MDETKVPMKEEEPEVLIEQTIKDRAISMGHAEKNVRWLSEEEKPSFIYA